MKENVQLISGKFHLKCQWERVQLNLRDARHLSDPKADMLNSVASDWVLMIFSSLKPSSISWIVKKINEQDLNVLDRQKN